MIMKLSVFMFSVLISGAYAKTFSLTSPDKTIKVLVTYIDESISYKVTKADTTIIRSSKLGNVLNQADLSHGLKLLSIERSAKNETWNTVWGEFKTIRDHHNRMMIKLAKDGIFMNVEFKAFNDGVAFRYDFPNQNKLKNFEIIDEVSEFKFNKNDEVWWTPAFKDNRYEYLYNKSRVTEVDVIHTPATIEKVNGYTVAIHEARLLDYTSMALKNWGNGTLKADLYPWANSNIRVKGQTPLVSPWRTIQIVTNHAKLVESTMILNLNDPVDPSLDTSFAKTGKYVGIWWGMHLGKYTWGSGDKHGATTENTKKYIDFAAKYGIDGVLVEGWNIGWDGNWYENGDLFIFDQPYDTYDIDYLAKYAESKGVTIVGHHETSASIKNYEAQLDRAYAFLNKHRIKAVKTGYVGTRLNKKEWHHGQFGVAHYTKAMKKGLESEVLMVVHEPIKQTGLRRTYPNLVSSEGVRGQEYNAWGAPGNTPEHTTIIPFTRSLAGPVDFTPGAMDTKFNDWRPNDRVPTTIAKQLALYVVIYSPWQMLCDLPENYEARPDAMEFLVNVPTDWETTVGLNSKIGDYTTIARKDRNSDNWYVGSITDENGRIITIDLSFLDKGRKYKVKGYQDARGASWNLNPHAMEVYETEVIGGDVPFDLFLAPGGGVALEFIAL
jgi:alpha-glucosidase